MSGLTHGDLFAGIAGFSLAAERAGMRTAWQVEIDPIAQQVLARHWPDVTRYADVTTVSGRDLAPVDVITAGFPCQDLSVAGKRAGMGGARSGLFWEITRIVTEMREATSGRYPGILLLENVPGWLSSHGGRDFGVALDGLADCGALAIGWRILDARHFRVAQRRRRLFLVCDFIDRRASEVLFEPDSLSGHPAPRREEKQAAPARPPGGTGSGGSDDLIAFDWQASVGNDQSWRGKGRQHIVRSGDYAGAVSATRVDAVGYQATGDAWWREGIGPLAASMDNGGHQVILAASDDNGSNHVVGVIRTGGDYADPYLTIDDQAFLAANPMSDRQMAVFHPAPEVASAITASAGHHGHSSPRGDGSDNLIFEARYARNGRGAPEAVCPPLKAQSGQTGTGDSAPLVMGMTVRRLTPTEAERLQGFPDDFTAGHADSHRYRMLGNAVAVPVVEWLLRRVVAAMEP